jgi:hypothetical protein
MKEREVIDWLKEHKNWLKCRAASKEISPGYKQKLIDNYCLLTDILPDLADILEVELNPEEVLSNCCHVKPKYQLSEDDCTAICPSCGEWAVFGEHS